MGLPPATRVMASVGLANCRLSFVPSWGASLCRRDASNTAAVEVCDETYRLCGHVVPWHC